MVSLLLPIIYLAFISLGIPDSLLGSAWPSMQPDFGVPTSYAGIISTIIAAGTVISSLASDKVSKKFSTGQITAASGLITALALLGFGVSSNFWTTCLLAIPYGLGAGCVDAVLNNYVAENYKAHHMIWLHGIWSVGCSIGPIIMGRAVASSTWGIGYIILAGLQGILTLILFISLPLWKKRKRSAAVSSDVEPIKSSRFINVITIKGVIEILICFFCYCAIENVTSIWASTYCASFRGVSAEDAASWSSLLYIGIAIGRFICGFISMKLNNHQVIRLGQAALFVGIVLLILPFGNIFLIAGLLLIGLGGAPIYPSMVHETPASFGRDHSQAIIGFQMAFAYAGSCLVPPLFGFLAERISFALFPICLATFLILMIVMSELFHKKTEWKRREYENRS